MVLETTHYTHNYSDLVNLEYDTILHNLFLSVIFT